MAEETKKPVQVDSELVGRRTEPTVLDSTTTLDIDTKKVLVDNIIDAGLSHS